MHILHVIASLSPAHGGPPEAVRQLVRAYKEIGVEVDVVCLDRPEEGFLRDLACSVHALNESFLGRFAFSPRLWRWLHTNAHRYDAIVMNGIWTFPGLAVRAAARQRKRPYGIFVHGALDPWFNRRYPLKHLKKAIYWPMQYMVLRDAIAVFYTTDKESELARTSFRPNEWNSVVVPYGIGDPNHPDRALAESGEIESFYKSLPALRGRRFLLFLARIHEKKGCDLLLHAFARVASSVPEVDLVIAGPDQVGLQEKLQDLSRRLEISDRVYWPGQIRGDLKWGALRACEAFILPSHQENFGIAVVEALSVGRPVLISNQVNIWQDIVRDQAGLTEEDTVDGTEQMLRRWFALPESEREALAANARPCFLRRFSSIRSVEAIVKTVSVSEARSQK